MNFFFLNIIYENFFFFFSISLYVLHSLFQAVRSIYPVIKLSFFRFLGDFVYFFFLFCSIASLVSEVIDFFNVSFIQEKMPFFSFWNYFFNFSSVESTFAITESFFFSDGLSDLLSLLLSVLCVVVTLSSDDGTADDRFDANYSIFLFFLFNILLDIALTTTNLLVFFMVFEMFTVPMFLFFILCGSRDRRTKAFNYFFWYTVFGSIPFLVAIFYLHTICGSLHYADIAFSTLTLSQQKIVWWLLLPSILFKIPVCPFHLWLPEAHVEASTNVSIFLAGILLKIGGYAYVRFLIGFTPMANIYYTDILNVLFFISCIWPVFSSFWQSDLKRIIAYMSVAHMGVAMLSLNTYSITGFYSGIYNFLSHGVISSALFLLVGILYERYKTRHILYYSGLASSMPLFSLYFLFFIFCNIGFPGSSAFIAELTAFISLSKISFLFVCSMLFAAFGLVAVNLWLLHVIYGPPNTIYVSRYKDIDFWSGDHVSLFILASLVGVLGLFPEYVFLYLENTLDYYFFKLTDW